MLEFLRRTTLERAIQLALAATIVAAVVSAGSVLEWMEPARTLRWAALLSLAGLAVVYARRRGARVPLAVAYLASGAFVAVAFASALWSADPRLTVGRAGAFALVLLAAGALAYGATRAESTEAVLVGVLAGAVAVALGGLLVLAFRYDRAVQAATTVAPARYQGLGGGPNMAAMVLAIATPIAFHFAAAARRAAARVAGAAAVVLLLASIAFSGSRGAFAAAFTGLIAYALLASRRRLALLGAALALVAATLAVSQLPSTAESNPPAPTGQDPQPAQVDPAPGYVDANLEGPRLQDDIGHPGVGVADTERRERTLTGSSGRSEAWRGAVELAAERPVAGYGFGTEDRTFVDRYVFFNSNVPENSYIGIALQLGVVGVVLLLVLAAALLWRAVRARGDALVAAAAAAFAAALVLAFFQSYLYAAGNAATTAAWVSGFAALAAATFARNT